MADDWVARTAAEVRRRAREMAARQAVQQLAEELTEQLVAAARRPTAPAQEPAPAKEPAAAQEPAPVPVGGTVLWCYGVCDGAVPDGPGIDGTPVRAVASGGLSALVSDVPAARFSPGALEAELEDMGRLEALARAHERVLAAALEAGTVVPFRLCTIYSGEDRVRDMLHERGDALDEALRAVRRKAEWSVKVLYDAPAQPAPPPADSGLDYLSRKRAERDLGEAGTDFAFAAADGVHAALSAIADDAVLAKPQDRRLSGHEGEMILNAAYLVADERADEFRARLEELAERHEPEGLRFQLAGPWPPHHFTSAEAA